MRAFDERLLNSSLVFNFCFADQHHGDVVANRIYAAALATLQSLSAFGQIDRGLTNRTNEDLQEFRVDGHSGENFNTEARSQSGVGLRISDFREPAVAGTFPNPKSVSEICFWLPAPGFVPPC